jgi:hypothetical protein
MEESNCTVEAARLKYDSKYPHAACVTNFNSPFIPDLERIDNSLALAKQVRAAIVAKAAQEARYLVEVKELHVETIEAIGSARFALFKAISKFLKTAADVEGTPLLSQLLTTSEDVLATSIEQIREEARTQKTIVMTSSAAVVALITELDNDNVNISDELKTGAKELENLLNATATNLEMWINSDVGEGGLIEGIIETNDPLLSDSLANVSSRLKELNDECTVLSSDLQMSVAFITASLTDISNSLSTTDASVNRTDLNIEVLIKAFQAEAESSSGIALSDFLSGLGDVLAPLRSSSIISTF